MPTGSLAPAPVFTGWDDNGDPLAAGTLDTFEAGTSTPATTWTDVNLSVANTNPIVLNSAGRCVIYLNPGASYKFVLKNSSGVTIWTQDNIGAVPASATDLDVAGTAGQALAAGEGVWLADGSGGTTAGRWHLWDADAVASSTGAVTLGMVPAAIASGSVGSIRLIGRITGLSSLTPGATYRISGTAGGLTTSAPANDRVVGQADTTTSFVFTPWSPGPTASATSVGVISLGNQTLGTGTKTADGWALTRGAMVHQVRFAEDLADHATSGTGATDVWSASLTGGSVLDNETLVIEAYGDQTADANTKTYTVALGATTFTQTSTANNANWSLRIMITRVSASVQRTLITSFVGISGAPGPQYATAAENLGTTLTVKLTLTHGTSGTTTLRVLRSWIETATA